LSAGGVHLVYHHVLALARGDTPVAAITAGLAKLGERTMSSCALEFFHSQQTLGDPLRTVNAVADAFLTFMRAKYDEHYANSPVPEEFREGPMFLVGGYGSADYLPAIVRVDLQLNRTYVHFGPGQGGIAWEGQSNAVERLIRGHDASVRTAVEKAVTDGILQIREAVKTGVEQTLQTMIDRVRRIRSEICGSSARDAPNCPTVGWYQARIGYGNLPLQDAIDFAAYLVNTQSGVSKFAQGVPTVGGRTHIGLITRQDGFKMIDESPLTHRNTGFL
jgi:hypothetical protein